jgi:hypothetical protein
VELGLVESGQLDRAGHIKDPVLRIARGEFRQQPLLLAQHHPGQAQYCRDNAERSRVPPHTRQAATRVLRSQDRGQHTSADHHLGRHPGSGEQFERSHQDQLAPPRTPGDRQPCRHQSRHLAGRAALTAGVELIDSRTRPPTTA